MAHDGNSGAITEMVEKFAAGDQEHISSSAPSLVMAKDAPDPAGQQEPESPAVAAEFAGQVITNGLTVSMQVKVGGAEESLKVSGPIPELDDVVPEVFSPRQLEELYRRITEKYETTHAAYRKFELELKAIGGRSHKKKFAGFLNSAMKDLEEVAAARDGVLCDLRGMEEAQRDYLVKRRALFYATVKLHDILEAKDCFLDAERRLSSCQGEAEDALKRALAMYNNCLGIKMERLSRAKLRITMTRIVKADPEYPMVVEIVSDEEEITVISAQPPQIAHAMPMVLAEYYSADKDFASFVVSLRQAGIRALNPEGDLQDLTDEDSGSSNDGGPTDNQIKNDIEDNKPEHLALKQPMGLELGDQ